ncbi:MAG TPA: M64 family metallopeptidase, partial [Prolixibacteraceae bacterium]|nr:M64 family metallopeptidase [Prolixibacteraceae bacterium]
LGDGYTEDQMSDFVRDANSFKNYLFEKQPFSSYRNYFNVFIIKTPSLESGVKHPHTASDCSSAHPSVPVADPNNYFGSTFDAYGIHRLLVPMNYAALVSVMANNFPDYDQAFVLANTPYYGGSGGHFATASLDHLSNVVALHEIGHSFAGLADEYWAGEYYAAEKPNMTRDNNPATNKWKNWLTHGTGIGIHQHGGHPWYKPANGTCEMEALHQPYCHVCTQAIIERIHELVNPLKGYFPSSEIKTITKSEYFSLDLIKPIPNTLKTNWLLNGNLIGRNVDSVLINPSTLMDGINNISVTVSDTSILTRSDEHITSHVSSARWDISKVTTGMRTVALGDDRIELKLFPNPSSDVLTINFRIQKPEPVTLTVYSSQGIVMQRRIVPANSANENSLTVDVGTYPSGSYYLELKTMDFIHSEPFIKR